jgi:CubicO group peptidase (beta-lactamase class C family)
MDTTSLLDQYFQALEQQQQFSGVVLITQGATQLYARAYGYASRSWKISNTLDIRFDTASITKLFTAVATLQLIDQGLLTFDTPVIDFLGIKDTAISKAVTIFHLLTHSSGIGDDADEENGESYEEVWKDKPNYSVTSTADFLPQFIHKPANFPPGQGCRYCNCSFVLLGLVIEKITSVTYRDYVHQHIFAKAGMTESDFLRMDRVQERMAEGCDPIGDETDELVNWKKNIYSYPPIGSPDGGAHVTAGDLDRFLRAVQASQLLSPTLTQAFLTPQVHYRDTAQWRVMFGYALEFRLDKAGQVVCYQKDGVNAGVSAIIRHYPAQDINVVLLANMMNGVWKPIRDIHDRIVSNI